MKKITGFVCLIVVELLGLIPYKSSAQVDPHYSQYYAYPIALNPALTGAIDGSYRVSAIYRSQWASVSSPFSTPGISGDFIAGKNINLGANVMNQTAGNGGYNYLNGYLSVAYTGIKFGNNGNQQIAIGISGGVINRRFNPSKFQYGDQWNTSTGYDAFAVSNDVLANKSYMTFDAGAGLAYFDAAPNKKANIYFGVSAFHLTQPEAPFISSTSDQKLPVRYAAHGGVNIKISESLSIVPNLLYMRQGNALEKMAGAYAQFTVNDDVDFLAGANFRFDDAASPYIGLFYKRMLLGFSYDVNTSDLGKSTSNVNSFELSVSFYGKKKFKFDPHHFICPRL